MIFSIAQEGEKLYIGRKHSAPYEGGQNPEEYKRLAKTLIAQTRPIIPISIKAFKINTSMKTDIWRNQHEIELK